MGHSLASSNHCVLPWGCRLLCWPVDNLMFAFTNFVFNAYHLSVCVVKDSLSITSMSGANPQLIVTSREANQGSDNCFESDQCSVSDSYSWSPVSQPLSLPSHTPAPILRYNILNYNHLPFLPHLSCFRRCLPLLEGCLSSIPLFRSLRPATCPSPALPQDTAVIQAMAPLSPDMGLE